MVPARLTGVSLSIIVAAAIFFALTQPSVTDSPPRADVSPSQPQPQGSPEAEPVVRILRPTPLAPKPPPPEVVKSQVRVAVYNSTRIRLLAARHAEQARYAGWDVVTVANWRGTFSATRVYHPPQLAQAARELAADLNISEVAPLLTGMSADQLTIILATDRG